MPFYQAPAPVLARAVTLAPAIRQDLLVHPALALLTPGTSSLTLTLTPIPTPGSNPKPYTKL